MNILKITDNVFLLELPAQFIESDEKPILNTTEPKSPGKDGSLILDFTGVQLVNGLGVSLLVKLNVLARRRGQRLLAFGVNNHYSDVFKVTGLEQVIPVYGTRAEALIAAGVNNGNIFQEKVSTKTPLDLDFWAKQVSRLTVPPMPPEAININIKGRRIVGAVNGFGYLWQKTYRLIIDKKGLNPEDIIKALKHNFPSFQPSYNRFYPSPAGIAPGEIVAIDSSTPGGPVSTGVIVLYADDVSFTFITPQGHPVSGWVTFSAFKMGDKIIAQILGLDRANDPVYEAAFRAVGSEMQVRIWKYVLTSLAKYLEVPPDITVEPVCIDKHIQVSQLCNVWYNAQIRTICYMPFRWLSKLFKDSKLNKA
jgi:anti-anti-sigma regulatory factor